MCNKERRRLRTKQCQVGSGINEKCKEIKVETRRPEAEGKKNGEKGRREKTREEEVESDQRAIPNEFANDRNPDLRKPGLLQPEPRRVFSLSSGMPLMSAPPLRVYAVHRVGEGPLSCTPPLMHLVSCLDHTISACRHKCPAHAPSCGCLVLPRRATTRSILFVYGPS